MDAWASWSGNPNEHARRGTEESWRRSSPLSIEGPVRKAFRYSGQVTTLAETCANVSPVGIGNSVCRAEWRGRAVDGHTVPGAFVREVG